MRAIARFAVSVCALAAALCASAGRAATPVALPEDALLVLCYHDVVDSVRGTPDEDAVDTSTLVTHFAWLRESGFHPVSLDQVIRAREGMEALPSRPVLLTFDDGYESFYTRVFPLLRLYRYPALLAVVGSWLEAPRGSSVAYGEGRVARDKFLEWDEVRAMVKSGLVEVASHSYDLHKSVVANREGSLQPAAVTRVFDAQANSYESDTVYAARIRGDLARNSALIEREVGVRPRAIVWPFGSYNETTVAIARSLGMAVSFTLRDGLLRQTDSLDAVPRNLIEKNPGLQDFLWSLQATTRASARHMVFLDLDELYAGDEAGRERRLARTVDRIAALGPHVVVLRAWHSGNGDGEPDSVYFPNGELPVRADLLNRVSWQLFTRAGVRVYASLPVTSRRLDGRALARLYEDMARAAPIHGLFFDGLKAADPASTAPLLQAALACRAPLRTVAGIDAGQVLNDTQLRKDVLDLLARYDLVAFALSTDIAAQSIERLVAAARASEGGANRVVLRLRVDRSGADRRFASEQVGKALHEIERAGGASLGYGPDSPTEDYPRLEDVRSSLSVHAFPD